MNEGASNGEDCVVPLKPLLVPRVEDGNMVVQIEDEDYQTGVKGTNV